MMFTRCKKCQRPLFPKDYDCEAVGLQHRDSSAPHKRLEDYVRRVVRSELRRKP